MFRVDEDTRQLYFNPHTFELGLEFELIGTLVGVAIYNSIILDIPFPMVVYKRLKGMRPTLEDLIEAQPTLGRSLKTMLDFDGDIEATFSQVFQVSYEVWGGIQMYDLKPNGGDIPVTRDNVQEYVDLYVDWALSTSVEKQYSAFEKGFLRVCGGEALNIFQPEELELLVCGNPVLDFEALERVTQYDDGFTAESATITRFWSVVHRLDEEEKRLLLKFATGSDRAPINGLASLTFVISKNGPDSDRLPTSHTCFNHLLLPDYSTEEKLEDKLKCAIRQAEGFGLR
uniref:HECT-type E3 ubiquitin transferase n=2 Tax=Rhizochromulina marina TaxID=1034831 RepID=A0A7S2S0T5_9STRA